MAAGEYRNFLIQVSTVNPDTHAYTLRLDLLVPGGLSGADQDVLCTYDPQVFIDKSGGFETDLLEAVASRSITSKEQLFKLGSLLSDLILPGSIRQRWETSLQIVRSKNQNLRLGLILNAPELVELPWEFLYLKPKETDPDSELNFLALQPDISIVRVSSLDTVEPRINPENKYRLVVALASPLDQKPVLDLDTDRKAISDLAGQPGGGSIQPIWIEHATKQRLVETMQNGADIFHFSGHGLFDGTKGSILLEKENDPRADFYDSMLLANLARKAEIRLAVLSACQSGETSSANQWTGVASALTLAEIPAVIASQYRLLDQSSKPMVKAIYTSLFQDQSIDQAVNNARQAIYQENGLIQRDWAALVLYLRVQDGILFPKPATASVVQPSEVKQINVSVVQNFLGDVTGSQISGVSANQIGASAQVSAVTNQPARAIPRLGAPPIEPALVGRGDYFLKVKSALTEGKKYYVYGTYGVGKTSLAGELFNAVIKEKEFPDGYLWVSLANMDAARALENIAGILQEESVSRAVDLPQKTDALRQALAQRSLLLGVDDVKDNSVARAVLTATASCPVILNGNKPLELGGLAQSIELLPLSLEEANSLFLELAYPGGSDLDSADRELLSKILKRLHYLPLAIKWAAMKHADGESLDLLHERILLAPASLFSSDNELISVFTTLYEDLKKSPAVLTLLARIAAFPAYEAPVAALRSGISSLDFFQAKDKLIDLGVVEPLGSDRLALHPVLGIGIYRLEGEAVDKERESCIAWLADFAQKNRDNYALLERELPNLLGLLDYFTENSQWDSLAGLVGALFDFLRVRGFWGELDTALDSLLENRTALQDAKQAAWAYLYRGILGGLRGDNPASQADLASADGIFAQLKDTSGHGVVQYRQAIITEQGLDQDGAAAQFVAALQSMGDQAPAHYRADAHLHLGGIYASQGKLQAAQEQFQQAIQIGDPESQAMAHIRQGTLARKSGDLALAQAEYGQAQIIATQLGHLLESATLDQLLGYMEFNQGHWDSAEARFQKALAVFQQLDYGLGMASIYHALGSLALRTASDAQALATAEDYYRKALELNQKLGIEASAAYNQLQLGTVANRQGKNADAAGLFAQALSAGQKMGDLTLQAAATYQSASLAYDLKELQTAENSFTAALALAVQVQDVDTQAGSKYYLGLIARDKGDLPAAKAQLTSARDLYLQLKSPHQEDAERVLQALDQPSSKPPIVDNNVEPPFMAPTPEPPGKIDLFKESDFFSFGFDGEAGGTDDK